LADTNLYAVHHNPFVYFDDVTGTNNANSAHCIAHIRPYPELEADLTNNTVARYNFITPNACNDMHDDCDPLYNRVLQGDNWLASEVPKILASQTYKNGGALFITWDESFGTDERIGMIVLSPLARGGGYSNTLYYTHSSTLRTFQEIFHLAPLLSDAAHAVNLSDLFAPPFEISRIVDVPGAGAQLTAIGVTPGRTNFVEASTDLSNWVPISTNRVMTNTFDVVDPGSTNFPLRFYRLVQLP
jgi:hypothetical protein